MSEQIKEIRENMSMMLTLYGLEFATYGVSSDKHTYLEFKKCDEEDIPKEYREMVTILRLLEEMGFPMNEVGTYLYKTMIEGIIHRLKEKSEIDLLASLKNRYSQFYVDIARNDLDIGIKTFHRLIESALEDVDYEVFKASKFSEQKLGIDYAEFAYNIALYVLAIQKEISISNACLSLC